MLLGFNIVVGLLGYYFRFVSVKRVPTNIYAVLSYFGIFMSYVYGYVFDKEMISLTQLLGTLIIVVSNYMLIR
jgi:drug/metabolite transporter (DMT)-like permease